MSDDKIPVDGEKPKHAGGRPSEYTQEIADELCSYLSAGESLRTACSRESMPCTTTFFRWLRKYPEFEKQYARAKEESTDAMAEEVLDIADDGTNDWMERSERRGGGYEVNGEHIQRSRVRIDTRKWLMAKMKPKKYGDKIEHEHSGKIGLDALVNGSLSGPNKTGE
jgi:hypothetical protein